MQIISVECPSCGAPVTIDEDNLKQVCAYCGREMLLGAGSLNAEPPVSLSPAAPQVEYSPLSYTTTLILAILLGPFGAHRFYTGHTLIGLIQLLTSGGMLVWWLVDIIAILNGSFRDSRGRLLKPAQRLNLWWLAAAAYLVSYVLLMALAGDGFVAGVGAVFPAWALVTWLRRKKQAGI